MQLVMPPAFMPEAAMGMALYVAKAVLHGKGDELWEMFKENL
jgi:pyruvate dehydrogenase (quinone)